MVEIMTEIERIIEKEMNKFVNSYDYRLKNVVKSIEQYVIKARIRQLEYVKQQELLGGYDIDEDIEELKKGLANGKS